jgi:hypothetical protein
MTDDHRACMDVAGALALLAATSRGGAERDIRDAVTPGTHGVAALVGAIILMARASEHTAEVIDVAIDALRLAQYAIKADRTEPTRAS